VELIASSGNMERIRILLVEDAERDAQLMLHELKRARLEIDSRMVQTESDLRRELEGFRPHLVLSDFSMPRFNGFAALRVCREHDADIPFIFVSGTIGEDIAVEAMKAGAGDYVMKANLTRLAPAVERELRDGRARKRLKLAHTTLRRAQTMAKLGYVVTGPDGCVETWSDTLSDLIGKPRDEMPKNTGEWLQLVHSEDRRLFRETSVKAAETGGRANIEYRLLRGDGAWIQVRQVIEPLIEGADLLGTRRWVSTIQDVTEEKRADEKIRRLNRVYAVLSAINALIVRVRERKELFREACRIAVEDGQFPMAWLGVVDRASMRVTPVAWSGPFGSFLQGSQHELLADETGPSPGSVARALMEKKPFVTNDVANDERVLLKKEHAERGIRSVAMLPLVVAGEVAGVLSLYAAEVGFFNEEEMKLLRELAGDIAFAMDHIEKEEKLNYLAYYDSLTGLANRSLFFERLTQSIHAAGHGKDLLGLIIVDIERFKAINDSLGRQAGDALLKQVAERLTALRDPAELGRVGPDQFAVLVPGLSNEAEVARLAEEKARLVFGRPYDLTDTEFHVGARAGIALFPNDGHDAESLFRNAEAALKRAKATGARRLFYTHQMSERIAEKLSLENKLRRAVDNQEFVLHYQPKIDLETRRIVGAEALIRWQSPELGLVQPMKFVPLLEETGLILDAGAWALRQAVSDQEKWLDRGLAAPRIAVNVSAIQLQQRDFIEMLNTALHKGGTASGIDLEITESLLMNDIEGNIETLRRARELGLSVAIDDFGTGHSSLAYLAKLPVDALKIDRSFIITMLKDPAAMTLVQTIISLAHSLRLKAIAEGVDSEEQANFLRLLRCDQMQGYLFSRPIPVEEFGELLGKMQCFA
jgi:diguanylate cyclase (GGDEF)-like protein